MDRAVSILLKNQNARAGMVVRVVLDNDSGTDPVHQVRNNDGVLVNSL
jgi:hypothetical protein